MMKTKVKVKRAELLKIVEGRLRKAEREHERAVAAYPDRLAAYHEGVRDSLRKLLERADAGRPLNLKYGRIEVGDAPAKPSANGRELCQLRRLHRTLQIGAEESLLLSQEDADAYFGPCKL